MKHKICRICGKEFSKNPNYSWAMWERQMACGKGCSSKQTVEDRIWKRITDKSPEKCWIWPGVKNKYGYGRIVTLRDGRLYDQLAHRASWATANGPIPEGLHVLHSCDTPSCINPNHLRVGTNQENMKDKKERGRAQGKNAIVNESDVLEIRASNETNNVLSAKYGVCISNISAIKTRKTWRHVQ